MRQPHPIDTDPSRLDGLCLCEAQIFHSWPLGAELVEDSSVSFGWPTRSSVSFEYRGDKFFSRARWAVIDVAPNSYRRTDSLIDDFDNFQNPCVLVDPNRYPVAKVDGSTRLGRLSIDLNMTAIDCISCERTSLVDPNCAQPTINTCRKHGQI